MRVEEPAQHVVLEPAEPGLAVHLEDRRERHARLARDEGVELVEGNAEAARDLGPERALARAAQAEQRHHPLAAPASRRRLASSSPALVPSASATSCRRATEMFPSPVSSCARKRSLTPARVARVAS